MDSEELQRHLKPILDNYSKQIERVIHTRLNQVMDQVHQLAKNHEQMVKHMAILKNEVRTVIASNNHLVTQFGLLLCEIDALEHYLAKNDPELKKLLADAYEEGKKNVK